MAFCQLTPLEKTLYFMSTGEVISQDLTFRAQTDAISNGVDTLNIRLRMVLWRSSAHDGYYLIDE